MKSTTIYMARDRIQFENCIEEEHSTGRETDAAANAWDAAAAEKLEALGFAADVKTGYGRDHTRFDCVVKAGNIRLPLRSWFKSNHTPARQRFLAICQAAIDAADEAGWEAARSACV